MTEGLDVREGIQDADNSTAKAESDAQTTETKEHKTLNYW